MHSVIFEIHSRSSTTSNDQQSLGIKAVLINLPANAIEHM